MSAISQIRNLGPASEAAFLRAGLKTAEDIHAIGADAAYARLLANGERAHFISYYVLVLGLQDRAWNDFGPGEKEELRVRFDRIKAETMVGGKEKGHPKKLEMALSFFGVIARG